MVLQDTLMMVYYGCVKSPPPQFFIFFVRLLDRILVFNTSPVQINLPVGYL